MKKINPFYFYAIAITLSIAGNFFVKRDSTLYYPYGIICIAIAALALYRQFKSK